MKKYILIITLFLLLITFNTICSNKDNQNNNEAEVLVLKNNAVIAPPIPVSAQKKLPKVKKNVKNKTNVKKEVYKPDIYIPEEAQKDKDKAWFKNDDIITSDRIPDDVIILPDKVKVVKNTEVIRHHFALFDKSRIPRQINIIDFENVILPSIPDTSEGLVQRDYLKTKYVKNSSSDVYEISSIISREEMTNVYDILVEAGYIQKDFYNPALISIYDRIEKKYVPVEEQVAIRKPDNFGGIQDMHTVAKIYDRIQTAERTRRESIAMNNKKPKRINVAVNKIVDANTNTMKFRILNKGDLITNLSVIPKTNEGVLFYINKKEMQILTNYVLENNKELLLTFTNLTNTTKYDVVFNADSIEGKLTIKFNNQIKQINPSNSTSSVIQN